MTNKEFLAEVQKSCHLDMQLCLSLTDNLQKMLGKAAVEQIPVLMPGLGVFVSHKHPEYIQDDSHSGILTLYPPRISYRMCTDEVDGSVSASLLLSEFSKVSEETAKAFIDGLVATVNQHLAKGEEIQVPGIGAFKKVLTHQSDLQHLSYVTDPKLKDLVNTPFSCFEPFVINEKKEKAMQEKCLVESAEEEVVVVLGDEKTEEEVVEKTEEETEEENNEKTEKETSEESKKEPSKEPAVIIVEKKKEEPTYNKLLFLSLALIICCSGFLLWLIFSDTNPDNDIKNAVVVEVIDDIIEAEVIADNADSLLKSDDSEKNPEVSVPEKKPEVSVPEKKPEVSVPEKKPEVSAPEKKPTAAATDFHRMIGADGKPVTATLEPGERLTLLALRQFGDKAFWPYIFDANADKLKAPHMVQAGMILYLPDPKFYHIDANDPESLRKAKNRGAQLLK